MLFPGHAKSLGIEGQFDDKSSDSQGTIRRLSSPVGSKDSKNTFSTTGDSNDEQLMRSTVVDDQGTPASKRLWVRNIPDKTTGVKLWKEFSPFGKIESTNPTENNISKYGFGYVTFKSLDSALRARKQLNGKRIFEESEVPVLIQFEKIRDALDLQNYDRLPASRPPAPKERISEWFRPRSRERAELESRRRISADELNERLPRRPNLNERQEWPNGPPPTGPKPRLANISPSPVRRTDTYRTEQQVSRIDSYRPGLDPVNRDRKPPALEQQKNIRSAERRSWHEDEEGQSEPVHSRQDHSNGFDQKLDRAKSQAQRFINSIQWTREQGQQDQGKGISRDSPVKPQNKIDKPLGAQSDVKTAHSPAASAAQLGADHDEVPLIISTESDASRPTLRSPASSHSDPGEIPLIISSVPEASRPTPKSPGTSISMEEESDDAGYSPKFISLSDKDLPNHSPTAEVTGVEFSSTTVQVDEAAELPRTLDAAEYLGTKLTAGMLKRNLSPSPLFFRRRRGLNDETCSLASEVTMSDRTGVSTNSSQTKSKCFVCGAVGTGLTMLEKCSRCSRRLHDACWLKQKQADICDACGKKQTNVEATPEVAHVPQRHNTKHASPPVSENKEVDDDYTAPKLINHTTVSISNASPENEDILSASVQIDNIGRPVNQVLRNLEPRETVELAKIAPLLETTLEYTQPDVINRAMPTHADPRSKGYTCFWWKMKGHCRYPGDVCYFAHYDTGQIAPGPGGGSGKLLTCHFWRIGRCRKTDDECLYAHHDTGTYASEPVQRPKFVSDLPRKVSDQNLRSYGTDAHSPISPRKERDQMYPGWISRDRLNSMVASEPVSKSGGILNRHRERPDLEVTGSSGRSPKGSLHHGNLESIPGNECATEYFAHNIRVPQRTGSYAEQPPVLVPFTNEALDRFTDQPLRIGSTEREDLTRTTSVSDLHVKSEGRVGNESASPAPSAESGQLRKQTAKRSGIVRDPRRKAAFVSHDLLVFTKDSGEKQQPNGGQADLSSVQANGISTTPSASTTQLADKVNKLNRCHICSKTLFGKSAVCNGCANKSKDIHSTGGQSSPVVPETPETFIDIEDQVYEGSKSTQSPISTYVKRQEGPSAIISESMKTLKRAAPADHLFVPRKKLKATLPLPMDQKQSSHEISDLKAISSISQDTMLGSPLETDSHQARPLESAPTLAELTELEQLRKEIAELKEANSKSKPSEIEELSTLANENENVSLRTDEQARLGPETEREGRYALQKLLPVNQQIAYPEPKAKAAGPATKSTLAQFPMSQVVDFATRPPLQDVTSALGRQSNFASKSMRPAKQVKVLRTACPSCNQRRVRCLHDEEDELDLGKCRKFLEDYKHKIDGKRSSTELEKIQAAANTIRFLDNTGEDSEDDVLSGCEETSEDELMEDSASPIKSPLNILTKSSLKKHELLVETTRIFDRPRKTDSSFVKPVKKPTWTKKDEKTAITQLKASGVIFESDSDFDSESDGNDERDVVPLEVVARPRDPLWQQPKSSRNLFDIAPEYLSTNDKSPSKTFTAFKQHHPRKQQWKGLLAKQCLERKLKFGNPHWEVDRLSQSGTYPCNIKTVEESHVVPYDGDAALTSRNRWDVHMAKEKVVEMPFDKFLGIPELPVACLIGSGENTWGPGLTKRDRGKGLAFRDGEKEKERIGFNWGRRVRVPDEEKWPVGSKG